MNPKRIGWVVALLAAFLVASCGTEDSNPLKPPHLSRDPQIHVTRPPTEIVVPTATEVVTATSEPAIAQLPLGPTLDEEQFLIDDIERLLTKIESKLDRTDVNP